jgi:hypothetical protein
MLERFTKGKAGKALADATAELEKVQQAQTGRIAKAREAFEASGSESDAEKLATVERSAKLMVQRAEGKLAEAHAALQAEQDRAREQKLAELAARAENVHDRIVELFEQRGRKALGELIAVAREAERLVRDAQTAAAEERNLLAASGVSPLRRGGVEIERRMARQSILASLSPQDIAILRELLILPGRDAPLSPFAA